MTQLDIRPTRYGSPVATALITASLVEIGARYGSDEGDATPVLPVEFDPPEGGFVIAYADREPAGCGGWRTLAEDPTVAEIKRMYVVPRFRGRGVALAVLRAIEDSAREAGRLQAWLETGRQQPEAIALYRKAGYTDIAHFGHYKDYPDVVSLGRKL